MAPREYKQEEVAGFVPWWKQQQGENLTETEMGQTPRKRKPKEGLAYVSFTFGPNKDICKRTFTPRHKVDEDDRVYLEVDKAEGNTTEKLFTLVTENKLDQETAKIKLTRHVADNLDLYKELHDFHPVESKKKPIAKNLTAAVKRFVARELSKLFDVGSQFHHDWPFIDWRAETLAFSQFWQSRRPTVAQTAQVIKRHEELLKVLMSRAVDKSSVTGMLEALTDLQEGAESFAAEMEAMKSEMDEFGERLGFVEAAVENLTLSFDAKIEAALEKRDAEAGPAAVPAAVPSVVTPHHSSAPTNYFFDKPLSAQDQDEFEKAMAKKGDEMINFPVTAKHFHRLGPPSLGREAWLDDDIIALWFAMVAGSAGAKKCRAYSSQFFVKAVDDDDRFSYDQVKRWSKKKNIFEDYDLIFFPLNKAGCHWALIVVDPKSKTITAYDSGGGSSVREMKIVLKYLKAEYKAQNGGQSLPNGWRRVEAAFETYVPCQENQVDCAVFVCLFGYYLAHGFELNFTQDDVNGDEPNRDFARKKIGAAIVNGSIA